MKQIFNRQPKKLPETLEKGFFKNEKAKKYTRMAAALLTIAFIGVIWGHSMMPGSTSSGESGYITNLLNSIFGYEAVSEHLVRKVAHFTEYFLLNVLCLMNLLFCNNYTPFKEVKPNFLCFALAFFKYLVRFLPALYVCLFVAVADESIQLFTVGRNGAILDIWIDHIGSITGYVVGILVYMFASLYLASNSVHTSGKQ